MFNVTQILPSGYLHAHALDDAAQYLAHVLGVRLTTNHIDREATNIIVGAHLLGPSFLDQLPSDSVIFNSEPRAEQGNWPGYARLLDRFTVWDYTGPGTVIPFLWCEAMAKPAQPLGDALLFYGSLTPRRVPILDALRASGVRIDVAFGTYGADRDARIARAGAILNLHKTDDISTFEPIRCFYPLLRGIPVISEPTTDPVADDFRDSMELVEIPDIAAAFARRDPARAARFANTSASERIAAAVTCLRNRTAPR